MRRSEYVAANNKKRNVPQIESTGKYCTWSHLLPQTPNIIEVFLFFSFHLPWNWKICCLFDELLCWEMSNIRHIFFFSPLIHRASGEWISFKICFECMLELRSDGWIFVWQATDFVHKIPYVYFLQQWRFTGFRRIFKIDFTSSRQQSLLYTCLPLISHALPKTCWVCIFQVKCDFFSARRERSSFYEIFCPMDWGTDLKIYIYSVQWARINISHCSYRVIYFFFRAKTLSPSFSVTRIT